MKTYDKVHKIAKSIVFCGVVGLLITSRITGFILVDIAAVALWFWGTNPVAYIIETILHVKHKHTRL